MCLSFIDVVFLQPIGALLLEQCRVEKEDNQSFSVGELLHPFSALPVSFSYQFTYMLYVCFYLGNGTVS